MSDIGNSVVYFEKQVASLCGVHCLNTLLQGSYFTEVDLAGIAHELDKHERDVMSESGMTSDDFIKFVAQDSQNVSDDGNYSIQVLEGALASFSLTCQSINNKELADVIKNPLNETGFICHLQNHWFTLRKINGHWFNLNSLLKNGPEFLSNFYVSLFLETLRSDGWTIFVVRGNFPNVIPYSQSESGKWISIKNETQKKSGTSSKYINDDDHELQEALKYSMDYEDSLQDTQSLKNKGILSDKQYNNLFNAINNYTNQHNTNKFDGGNKSGGNSLPNWGSGFVGGNNTTTNNQQQQWRDDFIQIDDEDQDDLDEDLKRAIAASLNQK